MEYANGRQKASAANENTNLTFGSEMETNAVGTGYGKKLRETYEWSLLEKCIILSGLSF